MVVVARLVMLCCRIMNAEPITEGNILMRLEGRERTSGVHAGECLVLIRLLSERKVQGILFACGLLSANAYVT